MDKIGLLNKLRRLDEVSLMELLELTSDDLVDAFLDKIDERISFIYEQVGAEEEDF